MVDNTIKLVYFDAAGILEPVRLALTLGGVKFEDKRVTADEWKVLKPSTKFGQLPLLQYGGHEFAQSKAIGAFAARKAGIYPTDEIEILKHEEAINLVDDFRVNFRSYFYEQDPVKKQNAANNIRDNDVPKFLGLVNGLLEKNGTGFLVGKAPTLADLYWYVTVRSLKVGSPIKVSCSVLNKYPHVVKLVESIDNIDKIKQWYADHPKTFQPAIKLNYFPLKGLAEQIRLTFVIGNVAFEDNRIPGDKWPEIKPTTKFGQMPFIEYQGQQFAQSRALGNFAARKAGLYHQDNEVAQLRYDQALSLKEDLWAKILFFFTEKDQNAKETKTKDLRENVLPQFLGGVEKSLAENNSGFFSGTGLTYADISWYTALNFLFKDWNGAIPQSILDNYPQTKKLYETVDNHEAVKNWNQKHNQ